MRKLRKLRLTKKHSITNRIFFTFEQILNDCCCRNEKIRTYNFNRHMLTDHRLGESRVVPNIVSYLSGDYGFSILTEFKESLEKLDIEDKFEEIIRPFSSS